MVKVGGGLVLPAVSEWMAFDVSVGRALEEGGEAHV